MFGSAIIDVVIGLAFVFALVSTLCSAIREGLEAWLKTRASYLEAAIIRLLGGPKASVLIEDFFKHPLIAALYVGDYVFKTGNQDPRFWRRGKNMPSYVGAREFALTVLDLTARGPTTNPAGSPGDTGMATLAKVRKGIAESPNTHLQRALLVALDSAGDDVEKAIANIESWFNGAMERTSGWYKRSTQTTLFVIALLVALTMNVNAIRIANHLYADPLARDRIVTAAEGTQTNLTYQETLTKLDGLELPIGWDVGWSLTPIGERTTPSVTSDESNAFAGQAERVCEVIEQIDPWRDIFGPIFGILATALAATLGAPFWFDIVNKFMVIRSTVKPREKSQEEGSEDRPLSKPSAPRNGSAAQAQAHGGGTSRTPPPPGGTVPNASNVTPMDEPDAACGEPITDQLPDDKLPPAEGGVEPGPEQRGGASS